MAAPGVNQYGITVLFEAENPTIDIVFVHGFTGHPERTWTESPQHKRILTFRKRPEPSSSIYWPRDLVPTTLPNSRVLTYGYDTNIRSRFGASPVSQKSIADHGWDLLCTLADNRRDAPERPLVFVAHSLGGLVCKVALIRASEGQAQAHLHHVAQSTVGVLFFGTPHRGADPFNIVHNMLKDLAGLAWQHNDGVVQTLLQGGDYLRSIRDKFLALLKSKRWTIFSFQEEYPSRGLFGKKVVGDDSSCIGDPELETPRQVGRDHKDMVRFSGNSDPEYGKVASALRSIHDHLQIPPEHPLRGNVSQENGPLPAYPPGIDPPVSTEALAQRQELLGLLYFDEIDARLLSLKAAHDKTCLWFIKREDYRQWLDLRNIERHHGFLWIKGKPGSGKSTLMKFLRARAEQSAAKDLSHILASFFFYAPGEHLEKSTLGLYRSLLWQLFQKAPDLERVLDQFDLNAYRVMKRSGWQTEALKETIATAIDCLGDRDLTIFIDALDECRDDDVADMVSFFEDLGEQAAGKGTRLRICFSSRHYPTIELNCGFEIKLEDQEEHSQDIARYISSKLKLPKTKRAQEIRDEVLNKSGGIFLWVALVIPMLNKASAGGRVNQLRQCLKTIPVGLDNLFDMILTRDNEDLDELRFCIQLILFATRPVTLTEYFFALHRAGDGDIHGSWAAEEVDRGVLDRFALSSSKGLAEVTKTRKKEKDPTVQFIHESVRDFFFSQAGRKRLWPSFDHDNHDEFHGFSHDALKLRCLSEIEAYHSQNSKPSARSAQNLTQRLPFLRYNSSTGSAQDLTQRWPFLRYATDNLLCHANQAQKYGVSQARFLSQFSEHQQHWVELYNAFDKFQARHYASGVDTVYILAEHGLDSLLQIHPRLSSHLDIRGRGSHYFLPLAAAILLKHKAAARVLVTSLSSDPDFAMGIEDCVTSLTLGRSQNIASMDDFYDLLCKLGHIPLREHFVWRFGIYGHSKRLTDIAFSPDGQTLASASGDRTIRLWDMTGLCRLILKGHSSSVLGVAFSPDGQTLVSASDDTTIRLWNAATGACQQTLKGHSDWVRGVAFSPDGQTLVSASDDKTIRLWNAATGACQQTLKGHSSLINAVAFLPDGQTLASASDDKTIRLWNAATGACQQTLKGHSGWVLGIAFSPDGRTLASTSYDKTIRLWVLPL